MDFDRGGTKIERGEKQVIMSQFTLPFGVFYSCFGVVLVIVSCLLMLSGINVLFIIAIN